MVHVCVNRKRHLAVEAINRTRAGIDEMLHVVAAAAFENIDKTNHIAVDVGMRILKTVAHPGLSSKVDDDGRTYLMEELRHRGAIGHIDPAKGEARPTVKAGKASLL